MAAPPMQVRVVFNRIPDIVSTIRGDGPKHVEETADIVARDAADHAPVDTGELRDSIHREGSGTDARVVVGAAHGIFVEYGTRNMPAQPYLWPAVERARAGYIQGWRDILSGTGRRSASLTVLPGRGTIRRRTGGRLPR